MFFPYLIISNMSYTMIYYYVPEDLDSSEELNAFGVNKQLEEVKLADIRKNFPLAGKYHFRFKHVINKNNVWMDLNSDDCTALQFQGKIILKVTRISWEIPPQPRIISPKPPAPVTPQPTSFNLFDFNPQPKPEPEKQANFDLLFQN